MVDFLVMFCVPFDFSIKIKLTWGFPAMSKKSSKTVPELKQKKPLKALISAALKQMSNITF